MRYISLFSGIEAASVAWQPLGWEARAFSEIEKFPCALLEKRFPCVVNEGDIQLVDWRKYRGSIDVVIGGSPCQSFSVAGLRRGLADPRGNLMLEYLRAIADIRPEWIIWENVPGVLSVDKGRAFGTLLGSLAELGYGFSHRILDAQFFRVAQRRRRVFVIGSLRGWQYSAAVLFEREGLRGNPQTSKEKREELARASRAGPAYAIAGNIIGRTPANGGNGIGVQEDVAYTLTATDRHGVSVLPFDTGQITSKANGGNPQWGDSCHPLTASGRTPTIASFVYNGSEKARGIGYEEEQSPTLTTSSPPAICLSNGQDIIGAICARDHKGVGSQYVDEGKVICMAPSFSKRPTQQLATNEDGLSYTLTTGAPPNVCIHSVRRLTPLECERLQGFPDGWTKIEENTADSPRYKALGNSMAVPVIRWIGERIEKVERISS